MVRTALLSMSAALALGCAGAAGGPGAWPPAMDGTITQAGAYLEVAGAGKPDPKARVKTQRRATSRDAAILDARERLLTYLKRIMVAPGVSVGERATEDEGWKKRLDAAATGIEVAETKWEDDDSAGVVVRAEKEKIRRALRLGE